MSKLRTNRRDFLKSASTVTAAALALGSTNAVPAADVRRNGTSVVGLRTPPLEVVRWGLIGIGKRGAGALRSFLQIEGSEVRALCDISAPALAAGKAAVAAAGRPAAFGYGDGPEAYRQMLERDDLDAIVISTPWRMHLPMIAATLRAGKHAFVEVPAAITLEECWEMVDLAEATQRHCMMMENVCYGREELMVLRMCREGVFGELLHGEGAYLHDQRSRLKDMSEGARWRLRELAERDGNVYPTHGLGPIAQYLSINRGDRFARLVSFSSPSLGLAEYAAEKLPADHPRRKLRFRCGDMNTSIIKTARGRTIMVQHARTSPHPYSRTNLIQGTRGIFAGYPNRIYVDGRSPKEHEWETDLTKWYAEFDHPLWKRYSRGSARGAKGDAGHGGMDHIMRLRIVQCLREGLPLDQDVYDAAAWSAIGPLSEQSVAQDGASVEVPDFTRGTWEKTPALGIVQ